MSVPLRLLLIEDSEEDALLLIREITRGGFDVRNERVETPEAMADALISEGWDLKTALWCAGIARRTHGFR